MNYEENLTAKLTSNKEKLEQLVLKKERIEREIENLGLKVKRQEFTLTQLQQKDREQ